MDKRETNWPMLPQETNANKCQSIYWNLICAIEARDGLGPIIVKELRHTTRCDHIKDLSSLRGSIENEITPASLCAVLSGAAPQKDIEAAESAIFHYASWMKTELYEGLNWTGKLYYNSAFHWDKFVAGFTLFGGSIGGMYKIAKNLSKLKRKSSQ